MPTTREERRSRRAFAVRAVTESMKRLSKTRLRVLSEENPPIDVQRPTNRNECRDAPRPCPFVGCKYHLALDVSEKTGAIKHNFPGFDLEDMPETCALDVADEGGATLERVGDLLNVTRERVRQLELIALASYERAGGALEDFAAVGGEGARRGLANSNVIDIAERRRRARAASRALDDELALVVPDDDDDGDEP